MACRWGCAGYVLERPCRLNPSPALPFDRRIRPTAAPGACAAPEASYWLGPKGRQDNVKEVGGEISPGEG